MFSRLKHTLIALFALSGMMIAEAKADTITRQHDELNRIKSQSSSGGTAEVITFDKNTNLTSLATTGSAATCPAAPTALAATNLQANAATYTWTDNASNETGFLLERRVEPVGAWQTFSLTANAASHADSGLTPSTLYRLRLTAQNASGTSTPLEITFTTPSGATLPATLTYPSTGGNNTYALAAGVSWSTTSSQPWLTAAIQPNGPAFTLTITASTNPDNAPRTGIVSLTSGTSTSTISVTQSANTSGNTVVTGVSATDGTLLHQIRVTWSALAGYTDYNVWRSTTNDVSTATELVGNNSTQWTDTSVADGVTYFYWVQGSSSVNGVLSRTPFSSSDAGFGKVPPQNDVASDTSFGTNGKANAPFPIFDMALQTDGKIIVVGELTNGAGNKDFAIARYSGDGSLDQTFGAAGKTTIDFGGANDRCREVAIQPDGRIVLAGEAWGAKIQIAAARLMGDGTLDTTFASGGKLASLAFNMSASAEAVVILPNGKIALVGTVGYVNMSDGFVMLLNSDGSPDANLNGHGLNTLMSAPGVTPTQGPTSFYDVAVQSDGKMVMTGTTYNGGYRLLVARFNANGYLDGTFATGGKWTEPSWANNSLPGEPTLTFPVEGQRLLIQPDEKILVIGNLESSSPRAYGALVRFLPNGNFDNSFAEDGRLPIRYEPAGVTGNSSQGSAVALQSDGKIIDIGSSYISGHVARHFSNGTIDETFDEDGVFFETAVGPSSVLVQPDGGILVGGTFLSRYYLNSAPRFTNPPAGGTVVAGSSFTLSATVTGTPAPTFQWYRGQSGDLSQPIAGATGEFLNTGPVDSATNFWLRIANTIGVVNSPTATLQVLMLPDIALQDNSTTPATDLIDGSEVSFGNSSIGQAVSRNFTLRNTGSATLTTVSVNKDGPNTGDFAISTLPTSVLANGTATFTISFTPSASGVRTATLHILSDDPDESSFDVTLFGNDASPPPSPTALAATNVLANSASYTWTDNALNENSYLLERRIEPSGSWESITLGANAAAYGDSGLIPSTLYRLRLSALNTFGSSIPVETTFTTSNGASLPATLTFPAEGGSDTYNLASGVNWVALSSQPWLSATVQTSGSTPYLLASASSNSYFTDRTATLTLMGGGQTFTIAVTQSSLPPNYPTGLTATDGAYSNKVRVSWNAVSEAESYDVRRSKFSSLASAVTLGSSTNPWFDDTTAIPGVAYYYWVRSWNPLSGYSQPSALDFGYALVGPGSLDTSFVNQGIMTTSFDSLNHTLGGMSILADGKFVVAGDFDNYGKIVRYNEDGSFDPTFGNSGVVTLTYVSGVHLSDVCVQPDGKVVAVGQVKHSVAGVWHDLFYVVRLEQNGALDPNFGTNGVALIPVGIWDKARCVTLQSDGRIVITGESAATVNGRKDLAVVRLTTSGAMDGTFSSDGMTTLDFSPHDVIPTDIAIAPDGKIVVLGNTHPAYTNEQNRFVVRYLSNGDIDNTFGTNGRASTQLLSSGYGLAVTDDNRIIVAGQTNYPPYRVTLVKFLENGSLDPSFGTNGGVETSAGPNDNAGGSTVMLRPDGKILVGGGASHESGAFGMLAMRYFSTGVLDTDFGSQGVSIAPFGTFIGAETHAMGVDSKGRIVLAGRAATITSGTTTSWFAFARFNQVAPSALGLSPEAIALPATPSSTSASVATNVPWVVSSDQSWLTVSPTTGSMSTNLTVFALANSSYTARTSIVTVTGNGFSQTISVTQEGLPVPPLTAPQTFIATDGSFGDFVRLTWASVEGAEDYVVSRNTTNTIVGSTSLPSTMATTYDDTTAVAGTTYFYWVRAKSAAAGFSPYSTADAGHAILLSSGTNNGLPDMNFGTNGIVTTSQTIGDYPSMQGNAGLVQPDGKIIVVGSTTLNGGQFIALTRYLANGSLDSSFGYGGIVSTERGDVTAAVLQNDGKIVVASNDLLARYNPNGTLDVSFGVNGIASVPGGIRAEQANLAIQSDGKILVCGSSSGAFAVARFNLNGSLDTTFDGDGMATTTIGSIGGGAASLALQADGKIVVCGYARPIDYNSSTFAVVRYLTSGALDTSFSADGIVTSSFSSVTSARYLYAQRVRVQSDGKILVSGYSLEGANKDVIVARYLPDGSLDPGFDGDGVFLAAVNVGFLQPGVTGLGSALALQSDGRIVVGGTYVRYPNTVPFHVLRLMPNGSLDSSFNFHGGAEVNFGGSQGVLSDLLAMPDDRVLAVGSTYSSNRYSMAMNMLGSVRTGELSVTFDGVEITKNDVTPSISDGTSFGVMGSGSSLIRNFMLRNIGSSTLLVQNMAVSSGPFRIAQSFTGSITPGASGTFSIAYEPSNTGNHSATVTITSTDADEGSTSFAVSGSSSAGPPGMGESLATAIAIAPDLDSVGGALSLGTTERWYLLSIPAHGILSAWTSGSNGTSGTFYAPNGIPLNDQSHTSGQLDFQLTAPVTPGIYYLRISSRGGFGPFTLTTHFTEATLEPPPNLVATDGLYATKTGVSWPSVNGAERYLISRNFYPTPIGATDIASVLGSSFADTSATLDQTYYYWVRAWSSAAGYSLYSPMDAGRRASATAEGWRQYYFGSSSNAGNGAELNDYDKDGLVNLIEYAFGLNPTQNSAGQTPQGQMVGSNYVISFTQSPEVTAITYAAEWSATMKPDDWHSIPDTGTPPQHTFSVPIVSNTQMFLRMKVTSP